MTEFEKLKETWETGDESALESFIEAVSGRFWVLTKPRGKATVGFGYDEDVFTDAMAHNNGKGYSLKLK